MALNIPNIAAPDIESDFSQALRKANSLQNEQIEKRMNQIKAQYLPLNSQAEAASKLAYSQLMGPQFLSKLFGNEHILANTPEDKKSEVLNMLYKAGAGKNMIPGSGSEGNANPMAFDPSAQDQSPASWAYNKIRSLFEKKEQQPIANPLAANNLAQQGYVKQPELSPLNQQIITQPTSSNESQKSKTFAENTGEYKGVVAEGKESGKIRAQEISKLNNDSYVSQNLGTTLDELGSILSNPEFKQLRQLPLAQQHELAYYAKFGTPSQQKLAGNFIATMNRVVVDSAPEFKGSFRVGEQGLLNKMKVSDADTIDAAIGKYEAIAYFNKMRQERSSKVAELMEDNHWSQGKAMKVADKLVNGEQIRKQIENKVNPMVTIRNPKTGETKTVSINEARSLGVSNV